MPSILYLMFISKSSVYYRKATWNIFLTNVAITDFGKGERLHNSSVYFEEKTVLSFYNAKIYDSILGNRQLFIHP